MNSRPFILVAVVVAMYATMTLALAGHAGEPAYPPIMIVSEDQRGDTIIVERGDHLWKISAEHLAYRVGRGVRAAEIGPYWRETIKTNMDRLRSGDPNLIYPGEELLLPPIELP
jgi:hypothetical protein